MARKYVIGDRVDFYWGRRKISSGNVTKIVDYYYVEVDFQSTVRTIRRSQLRPSNWFAWKLSQTLIALSFR